MKNQFVADVLYEIADLLDIKGDNFFKTRAYRIAAQAIEVLDEDIQTVVDENRLHEISGVGDALAKKITELVQTGKLQYLNELTKEVPKELLTMLRIQSLGPKKVASLYNNLGITTIRQLRQVCIEGKLRDLDGFGVISELNILRGIELLEKTSGRALLNLAYQDGNNYLSYLKEHEKIDKISLAGSLRRMKETIGDIDILVASDSPDEVMNYFTKYPDVDHILSKGSTKTSVMLVDNLQVDLRVVKKKSFGAALQYFTGSKEHNVAMRSRAIKFGYKLNEYGLFGKDDDKFIAGETEQEIYQNLELSYIEPELRENNGEISAAENHGLPQLVGYDDIKGDFHIHSDWSDGENSIHDIVLAAKNYGYDFVGITDHSESLKVANGLSCSRVEKKIKLIDEINKKNPDITIYCGTECDIKADGSMDYPNEVLKKFDIVYAGIHTSFKMDESTATKRIISAMENEYVDVIAHPTCRMIGRRQPFSLDMPAIMQAAKQTNTFLEINAFPDRLDLKDVHAKLAKDYGVKIVIGSDTHFIENLGFMRFGIATARRGWLEKKDILNTYSCPDIEKILGVGR
ncbi:MAG: DNA polymerase/3'-5' exonuclease PolX [Thermoplasmatota archaeon]